MGERYQWVTFTIHSPEQPNVPCVVCGRPEATWLYLTWNTGAKVNMKVDAYCDGCLQLVRASDKRWHYPREAGGDG